MADIPNSVLEGLPLNRVVIARGRDMKTKHVIAGLLTLACLSAVWIIRSEASGLAATRCTPGRAYLQVERRNSTVPTPDRTSDERPAASDTRRKVTALELLRQRLAQEQAAYQDSFQKQWTLTNQRFGPNTNNPQIEAARSRALSTLHQRWTARADALTLTYNRELQMFKEIDSLIPDPVKAEETKIRSIVSPEIRKTMAEMEAAH
jgi:hypothetical protein